MEQVQNPNECVRLIEEAGEHENAARWEQAEITRRRILALAEAEGNPAMISKAHSEAPDYLRDSMPAHQSPAEGL